MLSIQSQPKRNHYGQVCAAVTKTRGVGSRLYDLFFFRVSGTQGNYRGEIQARRSKEIDELRDKVAAAAQALGVSVHEILGLPNGGKRVTNYPTGKQQARYRGPNGEEWLGRGPHPRWMKPLLEKGKTKEDFLIK